MDKAKVVEVLERIGTLLELNGENPFKARAYRAAARTLTGVPDDLETLTRDHRLGELEGIGEALAKKIEELVTTGRLGYLERLVERTPPGLLQMLEIPSLGPRKVRAIHETLGVATVHELATACLENRLAGVKGFGVRSQAKILAGIEFLRRTDGQHLCAEALLEASPIVSALGRHPAVTRIEVAGGVRRFREVVRGVDLVCATSAPEPVMQAFTTMPAVRTVVAVSPTRSTVVLQSGIQIDLLAVSDLEFPFALMVLTGSEEHNAAMRNRARQLGFELDEHGLFRGEEPVPAGTEEEIFRALGLSFIPPELREDRGEIEAARSGEPFGMVELSQIRGVFHCHSIDSDGEASVEQMALAARALGFTYLGMADHSRTATFANGLEVERVREQWQEIDLLNGRLSGIRILKGIESEILVDGRLDYPDEILAGFDFVIGSVHSGFHLSRQAQTRRILKAMESPHLTMIGHPTGRLLLSRDGYELDLEAILDGAADHHVVIELNANPQRLDLDWRHLNRAQERGVLISIGPDAHDPEGLGDISFGVGIARKGRIRPETVLNTLPLLRVLDFLAAQKQRKGARRPAPVG